MRCPFCSSLNSSVKDSRNSNKASCIRRRRFCFECEKRFTTMESVHNREIFVIKKSGIKKKFVRDKIFQSILSAIHKRNIKIDAVENIVDNIMKNIEKNNLKEIDTKKIGSMVMEELAKLDRVSYIRFASVYNDFATEKDFIQFIIQLN